MIRVSRSDLAASCWRVQTLVVVCLLATEMAIAAKFGLDHYLDIPKRHQFDEPFHRRAREAILRLPIKSGSRAESILGLLERAGQVESKFQSIYQLLSTIKRQEGEYPCQEEMRNLIGSLVAQMRADPEGELNAKLATFINFYARDSFAWCVAVFERDFHDLTDICNSDKFDEFYLIGLRLEKRLRNSAQVKRDQEIGNTLSEFDVTRDKFDTKKMLNWLKKNDANSRKSSSDNLVNEFMREECRKLNECHGEELQIINLASLLGVRSSSFGPAVKLNEYNRLCRLLTTR